MFVSRNKNLLQREEIIENMGAAVSTTNNVVNDTIKNAITNTMESRVTNNVVADCSNSQVVRNVKNCSVKFAKQSCVASAISKLTSDSKLTSKLKQDMAASTVAQAEAMTKGTQLGNVSVATSNQTVDRLIDMSITATQSFITECSRNAVGTNLQLLENTDCSGLSVEYAEQDINTSVIGDCAATITGDSDAALKTEAMLSAVAISKVEGTDIVALAATGGAIVLMYIVAVFLLGRAVTKLVPSAGRGSGWLLFTMFLVLVMLGMLAFVWPGLPGTYPNDCPNCSVSATLQIMPHIFTNKGCPISKEVAGPKEMFTYNNLACNEYDSDLSTCGTERSVACGLLSCKSSKLTPHLKSFKTANAACSVLQPIYTTMGKKTDTSCSFSEVAKKVLGDSNNAFANCTRCMNQNEAGYGTYVDSASAATACGADFPGEERRVYMRAVCPANDKRTPTDKTKFCVESAADLPAMDCKDPTYQSSKSKMNGFMRACAVLENSVPAGLRGRGLADQCPPRYEDYFNCVFQDGGYACNYEESSGMDDTMKAHCRNDYTFCKDSQYKEQHELYEKLQEQCAEKERRHTNSERTMLITAGVLEIVLVLVIFFCGRKTFQLLGTPLPPVQEVQSSSWSFFSKPAAAQPASPVVPAAPSPTPPTITPPAPTTTPAPTPAAGA